MSAPLHRRILARLGAWWFAPAPAERLAAVRILVGLFAFWWVTARLPEFVRVAHLPRGNWAPTGVTKWLDGPIAPATLYTLGIVTAVLIVLFIAGVLHRYLAPVTAILLNFLLTYRNSWGMVFHTENLLVLHVFVLAFAPAADAYALWPRKPAREAETGYGWGLKLLLAVTAVTYVLAAVAKLRIAGLGWIDGELLRNQIAVDNLRKAMYGDTIAPLATPFLEYPSGFFVFSALTIVLELGAPIVVFSQRLGRLWAIAVWGFHVGVVLLMAIVFMYPLLGMAYLALFPVERVVGPPVRLLGRIANRVRPGRNVLPRATVRSGDS